MAPEQWEDEPEDERTDVFALGVMLYRMLTGEFPFPEGEGRWSAEGATLRKVEVPGAPELADLVERMLDPKPRGRPRDGAAALAALAPVDDRLRSRPPDGKPPEHARRRKATFGDLLAEMRRRHVFRVMVGYGVFAFAVLQVTEPIMHGAELPDWTLKAVLAALALGFPVAVVLAWIYDLTAQGVKRTPSSPDPGAPRLGRSRMLVPLAVSVAVLVAVTVSAGGWWAWKRHAGPARGSAPARPSPAAADARISVAVADFANETRDRDLDGLSVLLTTALEQSKTLRVVTRGALADALRRIGETSLDRIDEGSARRAGVEAGVRTLLLASIRKLDDVYAVEMRAVDPARDEYLFTVREQTTGKKELLAVIDRLSDRVRAELKEAPGDIRARQIPVATAATGNLEANAHYFRGQQIMSESLDSDAARKEYEQALRLDPEFPQAHLQLALLMTLGEADGDGAALEAHCAAVLRAGDRIPAPERRLAEVLSAMRQAETAGEAGKEGRRARIEKAVAADPGSKEMLTLAGIDAVENDRYDLAVQRLEAALRIDPGYSPAVVWLATVYENLGRRAEAVAAARRAVAARPGPASRAFLAQSLAVQGHREEALAEARKVLAPGVPVPYYVSDMLWPVLAFGGDRGAAEAELRRWTVPGELPARQVSARSALSFLLAAQGRAREVRELGEAMRSGMAPELSWWATAMADMLEGNPSASRSFRKAGISSAASLVAYLGDPDGAAEMTKALAPGSADLDIYRAVAGWRRGDTGAAAQILRAVIARNDDGGAHRFLGEILCERGDGVEGAEELSRWLERCPTAVNLGRFLHRPQVMIVLARCQESLGRRTEARVTVDRFLAEWNRADPGLPLLAEARALRARLE